MVAMDRTKVKDWTVIEGADYVYLGTGQVMRFVNVLVGDDKLQEFVVHIWKIRDSRSVLGLSHQHRTSGQP